MRAGDTEAKSWCHRAHLDIDRTFGTQLGDSDCRTPDLWPSHLLPASTAARLQVTTAASRAEVHVTILSFARRESPLDPVGAHAKDTNQLCPHCAAHFLRLSLDVDSDWQDLRTARDAARPPGQGLAPSRHSINAR